MSSYAKAPALHSASDNWWQPSRVAGKCFPNIAQPQVAPRECVSLAFRDHLALAWDTYLASSQRPKVVFTVKRGSRDSSQRWAQVQAQLTHTQQVTQSLEQYAHHILTGGYHFLEATLKLTACKLQRLESGHHCAKPRPQLLLLPPPACPLTSGAKINNELTIQRNAHVAAVWSENGSTGKQTSSRLRAGRISAIALPVVKSESVCLYPLARSRPQPSALGESHKGSRYNPAGRQAYPIEPNQPASCER